VRWLRALLLAWAAAACTVNTRGTHCDAYDGCPTGEKCAADGICRPEAATCDPWERSRGKRRCTSGGDKVEAYVSDPTRPECLGWTTVEDCGGAGTGTCDAGKAICSCAHAGVCAAAGKICSADGLSVLTCQERIACPVSKDVCNSTDICVSAGSAQCSVRYTVELGTLQTVVAGPGASTPVTAVVTRASADVPVLGQVRFQDFAGAHPLELLKSSETGLQATYAGTWAPTGLEDPSLRVLAIADRGGSAEARSAEQILTVDTAPPVVTLALSCGGTSGGTCLRDDDVVVAVAVSDRSFSDPTVSVALDTGGSPVVVDLATGSARVAMAGRPFDFLDHDLGASVNVVDKYGNLAAKQASLAMTRRLWSFSTTASLPPAITSPALLGDGTLLVGVDAPTDQLRLLNAAGQELVRVTLKAGSEATGGVRVAPSAAPAPSSGSVAAGAADGRLWVVDRPLTAGSVPRECPTTLGLVANPLTTPVYVAQAAPSVDAWFAAGGAARLWSRRQDNLCVQAGGMLTDPASGLVASGAYLFATTQPASGSSPWVRRLSGDFDLGWTVTASVQLSGCGRVDVPPAVDSNGEVLVGCSTGQVYRVGLEPSGAGLPLPITLIADLGSGVTAAPLVLGGGHVAIGTADGRVRRLAPPPGGGGAWVPADGFSVQPLGGAVNGMAAGANKLFVLTPGKLHVLDAATGANAWPRDNSVLGNAAFGFPSIAPGVRPVLYAGSADGVLRAVLVDEEMDASAPWPKAHHDVRNTSNPSSPLP